MVIVQCGVIFAFLALGELVVWATGVPVPSSVIGMLLLTAALQLRVVRLRHVERISDFLVRNLGFFFVPAGVALMCHMELLGEQWIPIVVSATVSTVVVMAVTGLGHQWVRKFLSHHGVSRK